MTTTIDDCRLWLRSVQAGAFKTLVEVLKDIIHDTNIVFDEKGGRIMCFDGSKSAFVHVKLRADSFEEYHCPAKVRCGVNMAAMYKLIRACGSKDTIVLYNRRDATNELGIRISNADKNSRTEFRLKLLDIDDSEYQIPSVEFDYVMTIPSAFLQRLVRDMANLSPTICIVTQGDVLTLSCDGDFASQETVIGDSGEGMSISRKSDVVVRGEYALKYLTMFCRASGLCNTVELFLKNDFPMTLKYNVYGIGEIWFLLAQKTSEDD